MMAAIQITSVEPPLNRPVLVEPAIRLLRRALALGLVSELASRDHLDLELIRAIAREAANVGIGQDAALALLQEDLSFGRLSVLLERLEESLAESPLPDREAPHLLRYFDREGLASLAGTSPVSLGRYLASTRRWPDELAARIHWLAGVVSDLEGAYNEFGVRRWFERKRNQLDGRSPREVLGTDWDPDSPDVQRVRGLASSLAGAGSAT